MDEWELSLPSFRARFVWPARIVLKVREENGKMAQEERSSEAEARKIKRKRDRDRIQFVSKHYCLSI